MLNEFPASAILVCQDLDRAKKFYGETLGFTVQAMPGILMIGAGTGTKFVVYQKDNSQAPSTTVLGFDVKDLDGLLAELKEKGVKQDMTGLPEGSNENGVMSYGQVRTAWVNDSEGNVIALNEWQD